MDMLLDQSSITTQDWVIFIYPSENTGSLTLRMSKMLVLWKFLSGTILEETSSQVIIQSNFGRITESGSGILRKE